MTMPTRRFDNDDQAAQHWLTVLRDGDDDQKIQAREQLAGIFERKGMFEEAADLLAANVRDGVRNADIFRWLARLYRAQGDEVTAMQAAAEAAKYMQPVEPAPIVEAAPVVPAQTPTRPLPPPQPRPRPWYLRTPIIIGVSALCLPPLSLVFIWMRPWRQAFKIAASVPLGIWTLIWLLAVLGALLRPSTPPSTSAANPVSTPPAQAAAVKPEPTPRPPTATPAPPTATAVPPTPTPPPDPSQAIYLDPRELVAEPKAHVGKNILLQGKALNVEHREEQKGILSTTPELTWVNLQAAVRGKQGSTETLVVEFYPRDTKILKDECYQFRGVVAGTQKVRRLLTGAEAEVPVVRGYQWRPVQAGQFGLCPPP